MKVKITKTILKKENKILELFSFSPKHRYIEKRHGTINYVFFYLINRLSIAPEYILELVSDTNYTHERTFKYEENKKIPERHIEFDFQYIPFTGKHACKKCYNYEKGYCIFKEEKLEYDYYQNCIGYFEKSIVNMDMEKLKKIKLFQE